MHLFGIVCGMKRRSEDGQTLVGVVTMTTRRAANEWRSVGPASRWLPSQDSNLDAKLQRLLCYRYTTRQGSRVADSSIAGDASGPGAKS